MPVFSTAKLHKNRDCLLTYFIKNAQHLETLDTYLLSKQIPMKTNCDFILTGLCSTQPCHRCMECVAKTLAWKTSSIPQEGAEC